ncbi:MAG TPA: TolC family protein [Thermoanaerobaculia bacterium]|nr:TolC family protein [Thermoanaerobaculia bacterium]
MRSGFVVAVMMACGGAAAQQPAPPAPAPPASPQPQPQQPLSVSAATSSALQQLSTLQQAQIDEAIAAEDLKQARAALLPRVRDAFTVTYNSESRSDPGTATFIAANGIHEYQNLLGIAGEFNLGLLAAVRRSRALLDAARAGTEVARRALVRGVAESYYGAALATAKRHAAEASYDAALDFEHNTELNFRAGEVPEVDLIRARLQTAARRDDLAQALEAEVVANASLSTLLGQAVTARPAIDPLPQSADLREIEGITNAGVARRPEVTQLNAELRAATADVSGARTQYLPGITYSVDHGFDAGSLSREELKAHTGTLATASIDVPLFDWGATQSRLRQAQLRARGAQLQRELALRDFYLQFAVARQEATTAAQRVDNARAAIAGAERNVAISVARYRAGEAPISEATDAQTTLAQQRLALQQALYDFQVARAHLKEAAGE